MAKRAIDRRVARTQATLHQALISLILDKGYEAITVEDICAAANIGRSTFYAHYGSKEDLHRSGLERLRRQLVEQQKESASTLDQPGRRALRFSLPMFEHARDHIDHYRAMVGRGSGTGGVLGNIRKLIADMARDEITAPSAKSSTAAPPRELVVQYVVGAYVAVLTWWLDNGAKLPPERIDAMFQRLALEGIVRPAS